MLSSNKILHIAFRPVSISLQFFGLQPYTHKDNKLYVSYWGICVTLFYLVTSLGFLYFSYFIDIGNEQRINGSKVILVISKLYVPGLMFLMLVTYIYRFIIIKNGKLLESQIIDILQLFENLGMTSEIDGKVKLIFRYALNSVLTVIFGVLIFDILFSQLSAGYTYGYLPFLIVHWPVLVSNGVMAMNQVQIVCWLLLIQKMYEVTNIACLKKFGKNLRIYTNFLNSIKAVVEVHKKLAKYLSEFGQLYSFQLFIFIVFNYLIVLSEAYFIINYTVFDARINEKYIIITYCIKTLIQSVFHLFFITAHIVAIINQVSRIFTFNLIIVIYLTIVRDNLLY